MSRGEPGPYLRRSDEDVAAVSALADLLGGRVGVGPMLDDLNRRARRARVPGGAVAGGFRWNVADCLDKRWWPQGVTSSADASEQERVGRRRVLATSWYARNRRGVRKGSRISFVDLDTLAYRHVLLVVPSLDDEGRLMLEGLPVHAGGIVWHGPFLHIAGTRRGLLTARPDDLMRVPDRFLDHDRDTIGVASGRPATFGYRYVLPVVSAYHAEHDDGVEPMRYSFLSLARDGADRLLVAGEYGRSAMSRRLLHYPLDTSSYGLLAHDDGTHRPRLVHAGGVGNMQGATIVDGRWYVTRSRGPWTRGTLCVGEPGAFAEHPRCLPMGPEDIAYWPSTDLLWSLSEWPGRRWVFSVPRSRFG